MSTSLFSKYIGYEMVIGTLKVEPKWLVGLDSCYPYTPRELLNEFKRLKQFPSLDMLAMTFKFTSILGFKMKTVAEYLVFNTSMFNVSSVKSFFLAYSQFPSTSCVFESNGRKVKTETEFIVLVMGETVQYMSDKSNTLEVPRASVSKVDILCADFVTPRMLHINKQVMWPYTVLTPETSAVLRRLCTCIDTCDHLYKLQVNSVASGDFGGLYVKNSLEYVRYYDVKNLDKAKLEVLGLRRLAGASRDTETDWYQWLYRYDTFNPFASVPDVVGIDFFSICHFHPFGVRPLNDAMKGILAKGIRYVNLNRVAKYSYLDDGRDAFAKRLIKTVFYVKYEVNQGLVSVENSNGWSLPMIESDELLSQDRMINSAYVKVSGGLGIMNPKFIVIGTKLYVVSFCRLGAGRRVMMRADFTKDLLLISCINFSLMSVYDVLSCNEYDVNPVLVPIKYNFRFERKLINHISLPIIFKQLQVFAGLYKLNTYGDDVAIVFWDKQHDPPEYVWYNVFIGPPPPKLV